MNESANFHATSSATMPISALGTVYPLGMMGGVVALPQVNTFRPRVRVRRFERASALPDVEAVHETSFFRDFAPFEMLRRVVLPRLMEQGKSDRRLRIWSAGCSTGQEAYSLAMTAREHFPELAEWDVRIIATDISESARAYAERGCYRQTEVNRGLPLRLLLKYFECKADHWEITNKVRSMVEFRSMNLCEPGAELPQFDLVLMRNVLSYLPGDQRCAALRNAHRRLHPHGVLMVGDLEHVEDSGELFEAQHDAGTSFYQRR